MFTPEDNFAPEKAPTVYDEIHRGYSIKIINGIGCDRLGTYDASTRIAKPYPGTDGRVFGIKYPKGLVILSRSLDDTKLLLVTYEDQSFADFKVKFTWWSDFTTCCVYEYPLDKSDYESMRLMVDEFR